MRAVIVDPFDSFVHTISQYLSMCGVSTEVVRAPQAPRYLTRCGLPEMLVLGPGPGTPHDSGHPQLVEQYAGKVPIFGICLGHQAIAEAFGSKVISASSLVHGKTSKIEHDSLGVFAQVRQRFEATRYHSLVVDPDQVGDELDVTATAVEDAAVMGLRHRSLKVESVQFHPESIRTQSGINLFHNFISEYLSTTTAQSEELAS